MVNISAAKSSIIKIPTAELTNMFKITENWITDNSSIRHGCLAHVLANTAGKKWPTLWQSQNAGLSVSRWRGRCLLSTLWFCFHILVATCLIVVFVLRCSSLASHSLLPSFVSTTTISRLAFLPSLLTTLHCNTLLVSIKHTSGGSTGGRSPPPRLGPKTNFIARPKNTHICKPPFACQNVLKLTYSNLEFQNFPGEDPRTPLFKGRGRRWGRGKGSEGGRGRIGKGREGRREGGEEWGEGVVGRGGALDMGSAPPRGKLWIPPLKHTVSCRHIKTHLGDQSIICTQPIPSNKNKMQENTK